MEHGIVTTPDGVFEFCERSDRILRLVLGSTADRTVWRFGPILMLVVIVAIIADWLHR
jgi:hypothetical protein